MSADNRVTVQIYNQTYHFSSADQPPEYVQRAAAYLDGKMRSAAATAGNRSSLDLAILAALDIAEEVLAQRQRKESMLQDVDQRISRFNRLLRDQNGPDTAEPLT